MAAQLNKYELFSHGIFIEKMTDREAIQNLINRLHPIKTQYKMKRFGGDKDGGYLLPDDLIDIEACFSPGVDVTATFEIDILEKLGINSHQADYSVDGPPSNFQPLSFMKKFLGNYCDEKYITLDHWIQSTPAHKSGKDLLLQMDIEGAEYSSILGASEDTLSRFRIILIEIHLVESWGCPVFFDRIVQPFFEKILKKFTVVHNHPNNCCGIVNLGGVLAPRVLELTLLRNDRISFQGFCKNFPHPDDRANLGSLTDLQLPDNWFRNIAPIDNFLHNVSGVIHVGANVGQEASLYKLFGINVIWVEPIPEIFNQLQKNIAAIKNQVAYNHLITDLDGHKYNFNISNNNGESSSIFEIGLHKKLWPEVRYSHQIIIESITLKKFLIDNNINTTIYSSLVIDVQGAELLILRGCGELIRNFQYIKLEAADFESYEKADSLQEIASYLYNFGFSEEIRRIFASKEGVGSYFNILYKKT